MSSNPNARRAIGKQVPTPRRATKANPAVSPAKALIPTQSDADGASVQKSATTAAPAAPIAAKAVKSKKATAAKT